MKRTLTGFIAALALCALPALAASGVTHLRADIPFAFEANGTLMPAGEYQVQVDHFWRRVTVLPAKGGQGIYILPFPVITEVNWDSKTRLEFRRYYDRHFLSAVATGPGTSTYQIPPSRAEKAVMKTARPEVEVLVAKVQ